jgi:hypothetical protein
MTKNILTKSLFAAALAVTVSAAHAEMTDAVDIGLARSAADVLHSAFLGTEVHAQAVDGVVYLYGHVPTYLQQVDIENAVRAAVPGHQVVNSIGECSNE